MAWLGEKRKTEFSRTQANQAMSESRILSESSISYGTTTIAKTIRVRLLSCPTEQCIYCILFHLLDACFLLNLILPLATGVCVSFLEPLLLYTILSLSICVVNWALFWL